jgi:hypothetical protein
MAQLPRKGLCLALAAVLTMGCMQPEPGTPPIPASRIIIKFVDTSQSPSDAFQVQMPNGNTVILRHERAMSGEAHVYNGRMNEDQLATIVRELNQRPDVDYAEIDRKLSY